MSTGTTSLHRDPHGRGQKIVEAEVYFGWSIPTKRRMAAL